MKNMKTRSFIAIILFFGVLAMTGCAAKTQNKSENGLDQVKRRENRRPDFGQPETPADIMGIVKSITGNEVTILKIERPNRTEGAGGDDVVTGDKAEKQSAPAAGIGGFTGAGRVPGAGGGRSGFAGARGGNADADMQAQMLERMKEMSTGEVKVIIPVGIRMLMPEIVDGASEPTVKEATLVDVKADKMMQIWLNKEVTDRQVADFVLIMR